MTIPELPKTLEEYDELAQSEIPVAIAAEARRFYLAVEVTFWPRLRGLFKALEIKEYEDSPIIDAFEVFRDFSEALDEALHWGTSYLELEEYFEAVLIPLQQLRAEMAQERRELLRELEADLVDFLSAVKLFLRNRPKHELTVHANFLSLLSGFMDGEPSGQEELSLEDYLYSSIQDEVQERLLELLHLRDALIEELTEDNISTYVKAAVRLTDDYPLGKFPKLEEFQGELLVDLLWFKESAGGS